MKTPFFFQTGRAASPSCAANFRKMRKIVEDTDLNLIADEIISSVRMLELSDDDTAEEDQDIYLPKIRRAAEDLNSIAANSEPAEGGVR